MLWQDFRFAARLLLKDRWFTLAAVFTLALGIGASNTVFTMVNGVFFRDMPFEAPDRVVEFGNVSYLDLPDLRAARTFEGVGAVDERTMSVSEEGIVAERYRGAYISSNGFALIGRRPILGRDFREEDERVGATPVVLLGYDVWRTRYRSDPGVLGRTVRINGLPSTVIGVMPQVFAFPQTAQLWQPLALDRPEFLTDRHALVLRGFGRLRSGVTIAQARGDMGAIVARLAREYPDQNRIMPMRMARYRSGVGIDAGLNLTFDFMLGAAGFVLLIVCANVASLLLARSAARAREVSVRMSLGASRWRIVRQLLVESALLAGVAGIVALGLSAFGVRTIWQAIMNTGDAPPYWMAFPMDGRVFTVLAAICLSASILSGLAPAWLTAQTSLRAPLNEAGRGHVSSRRGRRWTGAFVIGQLALTLILLSGAGLMMRSLLAQVRADAGVDTSQLVTLRLDLPAATYSTAGQRRRLYQDIEERFATLPGVQVGLASQVPLASVPERELITDDKPDIPAGSRPVVGQMTVSSSYFEMLGARSVRGRMFERRDGVPDAVAIVNERLAALYFSGEEPIGRRIRLLVRGRPSVNNGSNTQWLTIIGVAPNVRQRSIEGGAFDPIVYLPIDLSTPVAASVIVRSDLDPGTVAATLRDRMRTIDPDLPLFEVRTVNQQLAFLRWPQRVFGTMFATFAAIALVLAIVGLYAVTAYAAMQRTKEIGVRMALGAQASHVWWLVTRNAATQLTVGLLLGGCGAVAISRALPGQLAGASGSDPFTLVAVAGLLVTVALVACAIPARRALRLNPVVAMRSE